MRFKIHVLPKIAALIILAMIAGLFGNALPAVAAPIPPTVQWVAPGGYYTCIITNTGGLKCAGPFTSETDFSADPMVFTDVKGFEYGVKSLAAGPSHLCLLKTSGKVYCWGANGSGQLGNGTTNYSSQPVEVTGLTEEVKAIQVGDYHTCAITTAGKMKCWGDNEFGQLGDGTTTNRSTPVDVIGLETGAADLALGYGHTCALTTAGGLKCWGDHGGELPVYGPKPVDVPGLTAGVAAVDSGSDHTCVILQAGGKVKCWGYNRYEVLGTGGESQNAPTDVPGIEGATAISAAYTHTCALASGTIFCWGQNDNGQFGNGTTTDSPTPTQGPAIPNIQQLATGDDFTCAVSAGVLRCWGADGYGQLGQGEVIYNPVPIGVQANIQSISAGIYHTCAVRSSGEGVCWGNNSDGQLGNGLTVHASTPVAIQGLGANIQKLAPGGWHTCALTSAGAVKCWGSNYNGELGNNSEAGLSLIPVEVSGLSGGVKDLRSGLRFSCAIDSQSGLQCWGDGYLGRLGNGSTQDKSVPTPVTGLAAGVAAFDLGLNHACAVTDGGDVKCWGSNRRMQLGDGTTTDRSAPVNLPALKNQVASFALGGFFSCALTKAGGVKCWGANFSGQLGNNGDQFITTGEPVDVVGLTGGVKAIAATDASACAITSQGAVKCWGSNANGELGNGKFENSPVPVDVIGLSGGAIALAGGESHMCAQLEGGVLKCWGENTNGQLGNGRTLWRAEPALADLSLGMPAVVQAEDQAGAPGSFFSLTGERFSANTVLAVTVNGSSLGNITTNEQGRFQLQLDTSAAGEGLYVIQVGGASIHLTVTANAPVREGQSEWVTFQIPPGLAYLWGLSLPISLK